MDLKTERGRKSYPLDDGRRVTVAEVAKITGVTHRTAKRRVQDSTDPAYVLAPRGTRQPKLYTLSDGSKVTAEKVASVTGLGFESAKQRLQRVTDPAEVFKPHRNRNKQVLTIEKVEVREPRSAYG